MEKRMTSGEIAKKTGVYKSLELQENAKVLDLGCGYGKLWRNNWSEIPEGVTVDGYDLRGSWADDFLNYVEQNKGTLAEDTKVNLYFEDVEEESTWESIGRKGSYNCIIAQYLLEFIKDREVFLERIANALASGGMCSVNGANVSREHGFWQEIFEKLQLETEFLIEREAKSIRKREGFWAFLSGCFSKVETVSLESWMHWWWHQAFPRISLKWNDFAR